MSRSVLITGSAGYLGQALVKAFRAHGDDVVGIDVREPAEIVMDLAAFRPDNGWDVVICNAKMDDWGPHHDLARYARHAIVNVASIYGALGSDPRLYENTEVALTPPAYVAAKGAMIALTRHQATTLAPVRSNAVCPGGIFRDHSAEFEQRYSARVPLKRMANENDIVGPIMFLASDLACYITGQVLMVDGGLSCW